MKKLVQACVVAGALTVVGVGIVWVKVMFELRDSVRAVYGQGRHG